MVADTDVLIDFLDGADPASRRIGLEHQALVTRRSLSQLELDRVALAAQQRR